jgi:hypothetical protein
MLFTNVYLNKKEKIHTFSIVELSLYLLVVTVNSGNGCSSFSFSLAPSTSNLLTNASTLTFASAAIFSNFAYSAFDRATAGFNGTSVASASGIVQGQAAASIGGLRLCSLPQRGQFPIITILGSNAYSPLEPIVKA